MLRLLLAVSLASWMLGGLALQRITLGAVPPIRMLIAVVGLGLLAAVSLVPPPIAVIPLLALRMVCLTLSCPAGSSADSARSAADRSGLDSTEPEKTRAKTGRAQTAGA